MINFIKNLFFSVDNDDELNELKDILENLGEGIIMSDTDGDIVYANSAACNIFDIESLTSKNLYSFIDIKYLVNNQLDNFIQKENELKNKYEIKVSTYNDKIKYVRITEVPQKDEYNEIIGFMNVVSDITTEKKFQDELERKNEELKRNEDKIRQSYEALLNYKQIVVEQKNRLNNIISRLGEGLCILDFYNTFLFANQTAIDIFEEKELIGKNLREHLDDREWNKLDYQIKNLNREISSTFYLTIILKNKSKKHLKVTASLDFDKNQNPIGSIIVFSDITYQKEVEKKLKQDTLLQKVLINNLPAYIYLKDSDLKYRLINTFYSDLVELRETDIIGKTDIELEIPYVIKKYELIDKRILKSKKEFLNVVDEYHTKDGRNIWFSISKIPILDENNEVLSIISILYDISELKLAEKKTEEMLEITKSQKEIIEIAHDKITESILYARSVQESLLTNKDLITEYLKEYLLIFIPKDIVTGDFYYINKIGKNLFFTVADCTGHGVSGAFLTIIGITYIHEIVRREDITNAAEVLEILRQRIKRTFKSFGNFNNNGMDIAFCILDTKTRKLNFSGAYNSLFIVRDNEIREYKGTRNPIGNHPVEVKFQNSYIQLEDDDLLYMSTDGYFDQFNAENKTKFSKKRFMNTLMEIKDESMVEQEKLLLQKFEEWIKNTMIIDDITVLGYKYNSNNYD